MTKTVAVRDGQAFFRDKDSEDLFQFPEEKIGAAVAEGFIPISTQELIAYEKKKNNDQPISTGVDAALNTFTFGGWKKYHDLVGAGEAYRSREEQSPTAVKVGEGLGLVGNVLAGPASLAGKGAAALVGKGAAKIAGNTLAGRLGKKAMEIGANRFAAPIAETATMSAQQSITEGKDLSDVIGDTAVGAGIGAAFSGIGLIASALGKGVKYVGNKVGSQFGKTAEGIHKSKSFELALKEDLKLLRSDEELSSMLNSGFLDKMKINARANMLGFTDFSGKLPSGIEPWQVLRKLEIAKETTKGLQQLGWEQLGVTLRKHSGKITLFAGHGAIYGDVDFINGMLGAGAAGLSGYTLQFLKGKAAGSILKILSASGKVITVQAVDAIRGAKSSTPEEVRDNAYQGLMSGGLESEKAAQVANFETSRWGILAEQKIPKNKTETIKAEEVVQATLNPVGAWARLNAGKPTNGDLKVLSQLYPADWQKIIEEAKKELEEEDISIERKKLLWRIVGSSQATQIARLVHKNGQEQKQKGMKGGSIPDISTGIESAAKRLTR